MTFLQLAILDQLSDVRTADHDPVDFERLLDVDPEPVLSAFLHQHLRCPLCLVSKGIIEPAVRFPDPEFIHQDFLYETLR